MNIYDEEEERQCRTRVMDMLALVFDSIPTVRKKLSPSFCMICNTSANHYREVAFHQTTLLSGLTVRKDNGTRRYNITEVHKARPQLKW